jgi:hypothetical protein
VWWYTYIIPELGRLRKKDHKFEDSPGFMVKPCLKKQNKLSSCLYFYLEAKIRRTVVPD